MPYHHHLPINEAVVAYRGDQKVLCRYCQAEVGFHHSNAAVSLLEAAEDGELECELCDLPISGTAAGTLARKGIIR